MDIKWTSSIRQTDISNLKVLKRNIFYKIPKNWKTKFSFSEFLCILKVPYAIKYQKVWQYGYQMNRLDQKNWYMEFKSVGQEIFFAKIPKNWKTKFSFSEFLCILKLPWAMRIFALERNFLHFSTLLYAWTNISYANFDCSKFCQMRYPNSQL